MSASSGSSGLKSRWWPGVAVAEGAGQLGARVGEPDGEGLALERLVDSHRRKPEVAAGPEDAHGDLAPVRHEDAPEHREPHAGEMPCLLGTCLSRLPRVTWRPRMRTRRVSCGSMTSSMRPLEAAR